jgi:hypothetical protein
MCKDLRSMQLFAEQVLTYRSGQSPQPFRSYGFHEPNTDEGRYVYTIAADQIYYFLPKLNPAEVHRVFGHLQQLVRDQFGLNPALQQVVIVGESSTVDDRQRLQEAVDNYQFTSGPTDAATDAATDVIPADNPQQVTLLPSATPKSLPIRRSLSYINEDPYWDPRQDDLGTNRDGILHDRAGSISTWLHQQPQAAKFPAETFSETFRPSPTTTLQTPETELQPAAVVEPIAPEAPPIAYTPSKTGLDRRNRAAPANQWSLSGLFGSLANNLIFLLGGIGILGTALWLMRGGFNQPSNNNLGPIGGGNQLTTPPPPPTSNPIASNPQTTTNFNQPKPSPAVTAPTAPVTPIPAVNNQTVLPVAGFFVRSPAPYDGVNLRVGPDVSNRKIRAIPDGYWLVDEGRQIGGWREVSFQGQRGWIYRPFVR